MFYRVYNNICLVILNMHLLPSKQNIEHIVRQWDVFDFEGIVFGVLLYVKDL